MTSTELIPAPLLKRKAVVYVRQSTQSQVMTNLESQRRQYDLVDIARQHGFADIEVIDDDLGRSNPERLRAPGLIVWLRGCARARSVLFCAWMPPGSRETGGTGTICWSCAVWLKRGSLTTTACTILVYPMIACCWA